MRYAARIGYVFALGNGVNGAGVAAHKCFERFLLFAPGNRGGIEKAVWKNKPLSVDDFHIRAHVPDAVKITQRGGVIVAHHKQHGSGLKTLQYHPAVSVGKTVMTAVVNVQIFAKNKDGN